MKKLILVLIAIACNCAISYAQINLAEFISCIQEEIPALVQDQVKNIDKFMEYALEQDPELRSDSVHKVPIYSVYAYSKYTHLDWSNDSLFVVLNPHRFHLEAVVAYKGDEYDRYVCSPFVGMKEQAIYNCATGLLEIIKRVKPQLIFSLFDYNNFLFTIKNNTLTFWISSPRGDNYTAMTPKQYIETFKEKKFGTRHTIMDRPAPPIYTR